MSTERLDHIVMGAIFDFAGYLTTRNERITLSAADNASPAADAATAFLALRGVDQTCEPFFQWPARCGLLAFDVDTSKAPETAGLPEHQVLASG